MPMGRPPKYSKALAGEICDRLAAGETLVGICQDTTMPAIQTVQQWKREKPDFSAMYTQAREDQADVFADQIIMLADSAEDANLGRLQVDARKWTASKLRPQRYGDRKQVDFTDVTDRTSRLEEARRRLESE